MTPKVIQEWSSRVVAEYHSAVVTARMLQFLILQTAPDELLNTCMRVIRDELDHAKMSYTCFVTFGGPNKTFDLDTSQFLSLPNGEQRQVLEDLVFYFLLGESFAVPLFHGMYQNAKHPLAKDMLTRVLQDESVHRTFGWSVLDFFLSTNPIQVREEIEEILPQKLRIFRNIYAGHRLSIPLTKIEKECGLIDVEEYHSIWIESYVNDVKPRFAKRNISCPSLEQL
jgi:hypothetical protein